MSRAASARCTSRSTVGRCSTSLRIRRSVAEAEPAEPAEGMNRGARPAIHPAQVERKASPRMLRVSVAEATRSPPAAISSMRSKTSRARASSRRPSPTISTNAAARTSATGSRSWPIADFDQVIKLKPDHVPALVTRAGMTLARLEQNGQRQRRRCARRPQQGERHRGEGRRRALRDRHALFARGRVRAGDRAIRFVDRQASTDREVARRLREPLSLARYAGTGARQGAVGLQSRGEGAGRCAVLSRQSRARVSANGSYDKAIADYDAVLRVQPENPWALYGRGLARSCARDRTRTGRRTSTPRRRPGPRIVAEAARRGLTPSAAASGAASGRRAWFWPGGAHRHFKTGSRVKPAGPSSHRSCPRGSSRPPA